MQAQLGNLNKILGYETTQELVCNNSARRRAELKLCVTGGFNDDIELRICFADDEPFEVEDASKSVINVKLHDLVRAAACWEGDNFCEDNIALAMLAVASHLRHTACVLELQAHDLENNGGAILRRNDNQEG